MEQLHSYVMGKWHFGNGEPRVVSCALTNEGLYQLNTTGIDNEGMLAYGREKGSQALAAMTFLERANMLMKSQN